MKHRPFFLPVAFLAITVVLAVVVPVLLRIAVHARLEALGFDQVRGGSVSYNLHRIRIAGIMVGSLGRATIVATYSPRGLLHGRLDTIEISDTALHAVLKLNGALTFDGYSAPTGGTMLATGISLPASRVEIQNLSVNLETPAGLVTATISGNVVQAGNGLHLAGISQFARGSAHGTAPLDMTLSAAGWAASLKPIHIDIAGNPDIPNAVSGEFTLSKERGTAARGAGKLTSENLMIDAIPVRKLELNFQTSAEGQAASFHVAPIDGSTGIEAALTSGAGGAHATVGASFTDVGPVARAFGNEAIAGPMRLELSLQVGPAATARPVTLDLTYDGAVSGMVSLHNAKLSEAGTFDAAANTFTLGACGKFTIDAATIAGLTASHVQGCLGPDASGPAFSQTAAGAISLAASINDLSAAILSNASIVAELKLPLSHAAAIIADGQLAGFDAGVERGAIDLPDLGAGIRNLAIKAVGTTDGGVSGTVAGTFGATAPNSPTEAIAGTVGGAIGSGVTLALTAGPAGKPPVIKLEAVGRRATLEMAPTDLGESGVDLLRLAPGLATMASKISGTFGLHAEADWSGSRSTSQGSIILKNVTATTPNFTMEGIDAAITLASLRPLVTADNQKLTVKKLLVGLPLSDGEIVFGLDKRHVLNIADAHWSIAGGTISTYDQHLDLYGPDQNLGVVVKSVDLAQLLKLVDVNGLSAEGTLDGAIPLRHIKDMILVEHGFLEASTGGALRYDPAEPPPFLQGNPGGSMAILREALQDFHYQTLSVTIDGILGGEEKIKMSLKGANPTLYGGSPVALNLNLSGALDSIARSSIEAYAHPTETARRKLQKHPGGRN